IILSRGPRQINQARYQKQNQPGLFIRVLCRAVLLEHWKQMETCHDKSLIGNVILVGVTAGNSTPPDTPCNITIFTPYNSVLYR
ncbi:hypothetical protein, partial [Enterococcus faecalis]|uniref:hypothetical protein n=1 Tax=Enterococcus faecalis TaxID=1351 RepID=UPI003D6B753E